MKTALPLVLLSALALSAADRTVWKSIAAGEGARTAKVLIGADTVSYYEVDGDGVTLRLAGPSRLRIGLRARFCKDSPDSMVTTLTVTRDGADARSKAFTSKRSTTARWAGEVPEGDLPGGRDEWILDVPEGEHTYAVKSDRPAVATLSRPAKAKKVTRTEMTPAGFRKAVIEIAAERERTWYVADAEKPVTIEVTGPTTLRITGSLNFDPSMRGDTPWTVQASIDGKPALEKEFKSDRSHSRSYPDEKEFVPGQEEDLDLAIPDGRHTVEIRPAGGRAAAFRVFIPTRDLKK